MTAFPLHPHLTHPRTGERLRAIGFTRRGPIWPQLGASPDDPPGDPAPTDPPAGDPPADPKSDDDAKVPSAEEWARTLAALKKANKEAESTRKRLKELDDAKADADKTEAEKRAAAEQRAVDAELRATRLEVAHEKGLTPAQAKRLVGTTREEFAADADEILRDFPAAPAKPAAPKPDPSQGPRGGAPARATSLGAAVAAAMKPKP